MLDELIAVLPMLGVGVMLVGFVTRQDRAHHAERALWAAERATLTAENREALAAVREMLAALREWRDEDEQQPALQRGRRGSARGRRGRRAEPRHLGVVPTADGAEQEPRGPPSGA